MNKSKLILWLDDDPTGIKPWCLALEKAGYSVKQVYTLSDAKQGIESGIAYQLFILDVMIPVMSYEEEQEYPFDETKQGLCTGVLFYRNVKSILDDKHIPVLVMTSRIDPDIFQAFLDVGLPFDAFETKFGLRDPKTLVKKVKQLT